MIIKKNPYLNMIVFNKKLVFKYEVKKYLKN